MSDRSQRSCDRCGQTDDHPRHVIQHGPERYTVKHLDCCALDGCRVCITTEQVTQDARGDELLAAIQSGALNDVEV